MLLVLALRLAAAPEQSGCRAWAGAALAYAAVVAVLLAASRAGVAAAVLGVGLWLWLRRDRVEAALFASPCRPRGRRRCMGLYPAGSRRGRPAARGPRRRRRLVRAASSSPGRRSSRSSPSSSRARATRTSARRTAGRVLAGLAVAAALVGASGLVANAGRIADEFRGGEVSNDPTRFLKRELEQPARVVARGAAHLRGAAGHRRRARTRSRSRASAIARTRRRCSQPHSVPLQFLAGTGLVGLALFLALVAAAGVAAIGALRRLDGIERDAAAALAVALALWLVHALVDYDWDFVAVTGTVLFAAGVLAAAGLPARRAPGLLAAAGAAALALAAIVSVATPWLAERELREVNVALDRGDLDAAVNAVERARSLDPLSLEPVFAAARVAEQRRREVAALEAYREATRLQPKNPESWLQLGLYEFDIGDRCAAYRAPERGVHARPGRKAMDAWRSARRLARLGERRELRLGADDQRDVCAHHVARSKAVERPDDLHLQVARKPDGLGPVARTEHHERPREVAARSVADGADRVAVAADSRRAVRGRAGATVAVQDDHRRLGACQLRLPDRSRDAWLRFHRGEDLPLRPAARAARPASRAGRRRARRGRRARVRPARRRPASPCATGSGSRERVVHGRLHSLRQRALLNATQIPRANAAAASAPRAANVHSVGPRARG